MSEGKVSEGKVSEGKERQYHWDRQSIRALRDHMGLTQRQMADELGTRQQTISEWETGMYQPRGGMHRLLTLVAERAGFDYEITGPEQGAEHEAAPDDSDD